MERRHRSIVWLVVMVVGVLLLSIHAVSAQDQPVTRIGVLDSEQGAISRVRGSPCRRSMPVAAWSTRMA